MILLSNVFHRNQEAFKNNIRYIVNQGGSSSTKTYSILQLLVDISRKKNCKIDVLGQSVPQLKAGVLNDMPSVCKGFGINFDSKYVTSDKVYDGGAGKMHFMSVDKIGKAHGGRRDILYINEANHIPYKIAQQMIMRTRGTVIIDYNPTSEFWVHTDYMRNQPDKCILIKSTYLDHPCLEQAIIDDIESKRGDGKNNFWKVYGLGEMGVAEGLIFDNVKVDQVFDKNQFEHYRHGVDWGFSADPFAFNRIAIDRMRKKIYICDELHLYGAHNSVSGAQVQRIAGNEIVTCDSAEPKSVAEFKLYGVNSRSAKKGPGSLESGIKFLQEYEILVHESCTYTREEFLNYQWKVDQRTGKAMNVPVDEFNHHIDAIRYAVEADTGAPFKPHAAKVNL